MEIEEKYLSSESCKEGDIVTFLNEGETAVIKQNMKEKLGDKFLVGCNGKEYIYTPNPKAIKVFKLAWGKETKNWVNMKFQVKIVLVEFSGKEMQVIRPSPMQ
jgi:hypothetical protein